MSGLVDSPVHKHDCSHDAFVRLYNIQLFRTQIRIIERFCDSLQPVRSMPVIAKPRTLYEKIFDDHIVAARYDGTVLLYIGA